MVPKGSMPKPRRTTGGQTFTATEIDSGLSTDHHVAERVVHHVRDLIEQGTLKPGDRLPAERLLAAQIGISRPSLRAGLRALAAMGIVEARHGSGTFIKAGPIMLVPEPLQLLAALHGLTRDELFEARRLLEVGVAGLAAERATPEQIAAMADAVAGMFAGLGDPPEHLAHDVRFHRSTSSLSATPMSATSSIQAGRATQRPTRSASPRMNSGRTLQQRFPPSYTSSATSDTNRDPSSARAVCTTTSKALATFDSMTSKSLMSSPVRSQSLRTAAQAG